VFEVMSYLVESLVIHANDLKNDISSESLDDLLQVERCIEYMLRSGRITDKEYKVLRTFSIYREKSSVSFVFVETEQYITKIFKDTCDKIAYDLGSYFTDEGLLDKMQKQHKLDSYEVDIIRSFMKSTNRHTLLRRVYKQR
jgi:hypothetical protein